MGKINHRKLLMTSTTTEKKANDKLIHVASIFTPNGEHRYLLLRKKGTDHFIWYEEENLDHENETEVSAQTIEEAMRLAARHWKRYSFRTIVCGFRYTLPERDEHGLNALFHQMSASYNSMNGVYYDEELGNNCFVQSASNEALQLWQRMKAQKRL